MEYCPQVAVLHATFALIETEAKSGKCDPQCHTKGDRSSRLFNHLQVVVAEIISGLESPNTDQECQKWSRQLHKIFFFKTFVFNARIAGGESSDSDKLLSKDARSLKAICRPIPDFHPRVYFDLSDEFGWAEYVGECLLALDLSTALNFTSSALAFSTQKPFLLYDLQLVASVLDVLVSFCVVKSTCQTDVEGYLFRNDDGSKSDGKSETRFGDKRDSSKITEPISGEQTSQKDNETRIGDEFDSSKITKPSSGEQTSHTDNETRIDDDFDSSKITKPCSSETSQEQMSRTDSEELERFEDVWMSDLITKLLQVVAKRNSTSLYDRDRATKSNARTVTVHVLGHILSSTIVYSLLSASVVPPSELRACFSKFVSKDDDDDDDESEEKQRQNLHHVVDCNGASITSSKTGKENTRDDKSVTNASLQISQILLDLCRTDKTACLECLFSFFRAPTVKTTPSAKLKGKVQPQKLPAEKAAQCGKILKLNLALFACKKKPLKTFLIVGELLRTLQQNSTEKTEIQSCVSAMLAELERREKLAEEKRRNPTLTEVTEKIIKRLPRWKWCLQYGLAKRDLDGWWFAGFLDFLLREPQLVTTESDVLHLLSVLAVMVSEPSEKDGKKSAFRKLESAFMKPESSQNYPKDGKVEWCVELVLKVFGSLPLESQERVILHVYKDSALSSLPLIDSLDQSLTVVFNKLSASTSVKGLLGILPLALQDPLAFTQHALQAAVCNKGQISVVVKVLTMIPQVMGSLHSERHPRNTLLCHCLRQTLTGNPLDPTQQKNVLKLIISLLKAKADIGPNTQQPPPPPPLPSPSPLLTPSELLSTCILPHISVQQNPPIRISLDFALRLLIGCLEAALSVDLFDWLEEVDSAVVVGSCACVLEECVEGVGVGEGVEMETERVVQVKTLTLTALDRLQKLMCKGGCFLKASSIAWLQQKAGNLDWTVCAYIAPFLVTSPSDDTNQILSEMALDAARNLPSSTAVLLQLAATSDLAMECVLDVVQQLGDCVLPYSVVLSSLCQVLPHILVTEVKRVMNVLSALVEADMVDVASRPPAYHTSLVDSGKDTAVAQLLAEVLFPDILVSQLLMESVVLIVSQKDLSSPASHHLAQVAVAGFQVLVLSANGERDASWKDPTSLNLHVFSHLCMIMSSAPEVMFDPMFIALLDLATRIAERSKGGKLRPSEVNEVTGRQFSAAEYARLIPQDNMRDTLCKKLEGSLSL